MYAAYDNNGKLICLTTSREFAIETADSHYKDTAEWPIIGDEFPSDTPVCDGAGNNIGTLNSLMRPVTLPHIAQSYPFAYSTIAQAAREGRIEAWRSGATWLTTRAAIEEAIEEGRLRPRKKDG